MTIAIHSPIFPASNEDVTYTLENLSASNLKRVELYETVSKIDGQGALTPGSELLLKMWDSPGQRMDFTKTGGYPAGSLVRYRFSVQTPSGGCFHCTETYNQEVTFATRPYPLTLDPAPIYVVGDPDQVFDIVLIPDRDVLDDMEAFRRNCLGMIRESFLDEPTTQVFRRSFNFYINPYPGEAVDYDTMVATGRDHQPPMNFDRLSFAEGLALMHKGVLRDYTLMDKKLYSTEMTNRGTILHESGHGLFGLADEYWAGAHWKENTEPNNWNAEADAKSDAPRRGKSASDVQMIVDGVWWKLCDDNCQMKTAGETRARYDRPCHDRVVWAVLNNAGCDAE